MRLDHFLVLLAALCGLFALLVLNSCAADADCELPRNALYVRTELTGNCGPMPPTLAHMDTTPPEGCTVERHEATCWVEGTSSCDGGSSRKWWLDGSSGSWVGEDSWQTSRCASVYRLELQPR